MINPTIKTAIKEWKAAGKAIRALIADERKRERAACKAKVAKLPKVADEKLEIKFHYWISLDPDDIWLPQGLERDARKHYRVRTQYKTNDNMHFGTLQAAQGHAKYVRDNERREERAILKQAKAILAKKKK